MVVPYLGCTWFEHYRPVDICLYCVASGTGCKAPKRSSLIFRCKERRIGAFSRRLAFSDLDGRRNAGKYVNSIKNDLEAQIGTPSPGQQILIKLVTVKMLRCLTHEVLAKENSSIWNAGMAR
jgi:hypothetical protein